MSTTQNPSALPLAQQRCEHRSGAPLSERGCQMMLTQVPDWAVDDSVPGGVLHRTFAFKDFHATMAFVNAVAWVAHQQDHHPDLTASYNRCTLRWSTHSVAGLSLNDFICAARVDALSL
ncbi:4a-hydroxytetrahydrobiopterin dehydratase [Aquabacterium sp.]|uniref:4a-hydroxytetrahydrobiopterin dehydratase n=1 Tax=Aquabacterium sp. TaxID=1872578 RepID=UPI00198FA5D2|nr:4a-hydroxytetrahydrobiopterin dehydratase [Aquabacterium sp.]MBC7699750.1 4a-hydroxytetrahydrobiopterin dehydratase [Aquabacterium sp.]